MKCDRCGKNEVFTKVMVQTPDKTEELNLCRECFAGFLLEHPEIKSGMGEDISKMMGDLFPDMLKNISKMNNQKGNKIFGNTFVKKQLKGENSKNIKICSNCQTVLDNIKKTSQVGCPNCYNIFQKEINQIILHTSGENLETQNNLKATTDEEKVKKLEITLKNAVESEMYELAAQVRDDIKLLKQN